MTVYVRNIETEDHVILIWTGEAGDVLPNRNGVKHPHDTVIVSGTVLLEIEGERPQTLTAPATVVLPVNTSYTFTGIEGPGVVHCFYPKRIPGATEEIRHLRTEVPLRMN